MSAGTLQEPTALEDANAVLERMIAEIKLITDAPPLPTVREGGGIGDGPVADPTHGRMQPAADAPWPRDHGARPRTPEPAADVHPAPPDGDGPSMPVQGVADAGIASDPPVDAITLVGGDRPEGRTGPAPGAPATGPAPEASAAPTGRPSAATRPSEGRHSQAIVEWDRLDEGLSRFNPLDLLTIPPAGSARRQYLGEVASILVADGSDETSIVVKTRRLVCALCEVAVARTESTTDGPSASLPQVAEWVETHLVEPGSATIDAAAMAAERAASMTAAIAALTDVEAGVARRGRAALLALRSDPRSHDVIALAMEALEPFQEDVLRRITETSDFGPGNFEGEDHGAPSFRVQAVRTSDLGRMLTRLMHACLTISLDTAGPRHIDVISSYRGPNGTRRIQGLD